MEILTRAPILDGEVRCETVQGIDLHGCILKVTRHQAVFEIYTSYLVLRVSEALSNFRIVLEGRIAYSGRAVVTNLLNAGSVLMCEANLEDSWVDPDLLALTLQPKGLRAGFDTFLRQWEKIYKIGSEFKIITSDLHSFMTDIRLWLEQVELGIRSLPSGSRLHAEREAVHELAGSITPALSFFFEKFERAAADVDTESRPAHGAFCRRQLHPLLLASPFMHRIYAKPLGYAGDYEMVNMILRDPCEGSSVFAKLLNVFILNQGPAIAHRNRVSYLTKVLMEETVRASRVGRSARILNLGCGPAKEVQDFLIQQDISDRADFELLDFDEQTLSHLRQRLDEIKRTHGRRTGLTLAKKSVNQILKQSGKPNGNTAQYDLIYCAGLFDYLNDRTCKILLSFFYDLLAPGALLLTTNVEKNNPIRNIMEYLFEWHLIYRSGTQFSAMAPPQAPLDGVSLKADTSSGNIFLEVRKPHVTP